MKIGIVDTNTMFFAPLPMGGMTVPLLTYLKQIYGY